MRTGTGRGPTAEINVTPMADIMIEAMNVAQGAGAQRLGLR